LITAPSMCAALGEAVVRGGHNLNVIDEAELREMTPAQRRELARTLAAIDYPHPLLELNWHRGRKLGAIMSMIACIVLFGWIIVLILTLHRHYTATHWRFAWVGFDLLLLGAFALTGWAFWRGRQIVIAFLLVTGALLCCDAWFDVILDLGTNGVWESVASAAVIELPLAFVMFQAARRLIRLSTLVAVGARGDVEVIPSIWRMPLLGGEGEGRTAPTGRSLTRRGGPTAMSGGGDGGSADQSRGLA
jgi:hypothetical protein